MNLPTHLVIKVKEYAENLGLPVTHAYTILIDKALQYDKIVPLLYQNIVESTFVSEEKKLNVSDDLF